MNRKNELATFDIWQIFFDGLMIVLAYSVSCFIYRMLKGTSVLVAHIPMLLCFAIIFILNMCVARMYNITTFYYTDRVIARTLRSAIIASFSLSMVIFLLKQETMSRLLFVVFCVLCIAFVLTQRLLRARLRRTGLGATRMVYFGDEQTYEKYIGFVKKTAMSVTVLDVQTLYSDILKDTESLEKYLVKKAVDEVIFVYSPKEEFDFRPYLQVCEDMGITARLVLDMFEMPESSRFLSSVGTYPVITYHSSSLNSYQLFVKRVTDISVSFLGLVLLSPVFLLTALAIKLNSPGPVIFKQKRAGRNGRIFTMYKFRTMVADAEARKCDLMEYNKVKDSRMFKMDDDPRITKIGDFLRKASIDELPQLVNVLKGDMSLVGTRPPTLDEIQLYERCHWRRISIKPGITGMWQVSGRSDIIDFEEVVELDRHYINNWSLGMDAKLILRTIGVVLGHRGAY